MDSNENYNLLLCGQPASAKTLFVLGILECRKGAHVRTIASVNNEGAHVKDDACVWKNGSDIRDVISIGKLVRKSDGLDEI